MFGIKADRSWKGEKKAYPTKEYDNNGNLLTVVAYFRKYNSYEESLNDHGRFFHVNKRYVNVIGLTDYKEQARAIQAAGYATDPQYANKLIRLIEQNVLQNWDKEVLSSSSRTQQAGQPTHTVKEGETVSRIAQKYGVSLQAVVEVNQLANPNLIYPGQQLVIPVSVAQPDSQLYTVKEGDTLSSIAQKFNTSIQKLAADNAIPNLNHIQVGQKLYVASRD